MKRTVILIIVCIFLPAVLLSAGGQKEETGSPETEPVIIKLGSVANETNIQYEATKRFADLVREKSNGQIDIQLFFSGQLGNEADMIDSLQVGGIQMMQSFPTKWSSFIPEMGVLDLPFQFADFDHARRVTDSDVGETLGEMIRERTGVTVLRWLPHGFRHMYTKRPIYSVSDMAGLQIRVPGIDVYERTFNLLGASPISVPWTELYTALQTGMVEAAEADLSGALASGFADITDYVIKTGHIYTASFLVINDDFFSSLSKEQQKILLDAADETEAWLYEKISEIMEQDEQRAKDSGMEIIEPDLDSFRQKLEPIVDDFRKTVDVDSLLEIINDLR